jgi:hypothetical protein
MADYRDDGTSVYHRPTGRFIPKVEGNVDYAAFLAWDAVPGNDPDPPDPPPIRLSATAPIAAATGRTTSNETIELFRGPTEAHAGYEATITVIGINAANGQMRRATITVTVGRWDAGAVIAGQTVLANHTAGATPPLIPTAGIDGNDYVIQASGQMNQSIDWILFGEIRAFKPEGLA